MEICCAALGLGGGLLVLAVGARPVAAAALTGNVRYYVEDRPVPGVNLQLSGAADQSVGTDSAGDFAFADVSDGTWLLEPSKSQDTGNAINALDAVYELQAVVGLRTLDERQKLACDVTGDGTLNALDAVRILQFVVGLIDRFPVAETCGSDWAFVPEAALLPNEQLIQPLADTTGCQHGGVVFSAPQQETSQDFVGILFGDCSGNWQPTQAQQVPSATPTASLTATSTPTYSVSATETVTWTATPDVTSTTTPVSTLTATPSSAPATPATATATASPTPTATVTWTAIPSVPSTTTATNTVTPTATATATRTATPTRTPTPTSTATATRTATPTHGARPLGTVTLLSGPTDCNGESCYTVEVHCSQLRNVRDAVLKVGEPTSLPFRGTILFATGWTGTSLWESLSSEAPRVLSEVRAAGFRTVQMDWQKNWFRGASFALEGFGCLACRPASVARWVYDNLHDSTGDAAFCAIGHSNGASQVAFSLAQYGLADILSAVVLDSGPNFTRVDIGCLQGDPAYSAMWFTQNGRQTADWAFGYPNDGTGPCSRRIASYRSEFEEASLALGNWQYVYPTTMVHSVFGALDGSFTAAQGMFFYDWIEQAGSPLVRLDIVPNAPHYTVSTVQGADLLRDALINECHLQ